MFLPLFPPLLWIPIAWGIGASMCGFDNDRKYRGPAKHYDDDGHCMDCAPPTLKRKRRKVIKKAK